MPQAVARFAKPRQFVRIEAAMQTRRAAFHWPEYLIEAAALGTFMISAAVFTTILFYPWSPVAHAISSGMARRALMGLAMASTALTIIYSPWGQRSGAHMNPAVTLTFFRLGKVARRDFLGYVTAQFAGGIIGIGVAAIALRGILSDPSVDYVTTMPGPGGQAVAFVAEVVISFVLMMTVLFVSNHPRLGRYTGLCAAFLVWTYITFEAPLSGMSTNPARSFGPALLAWDFPSLWIYFTAPPLGMLLAAELFTRRFGLQHVLCAKLHHPAIGPCIFGCARSTTS
jgi:aquaporin Z